MPRKQTTRPRCFRGSVFPNRGSPWNGNPATPQPKPGERWLLVTSAYHMPRSIGLFRKAGFAVEAYPVDWKVGKKDDLFKYYVVSSDGLHLVNTGVREWLGLIAYRVSGGTDALLPGPE